MITYLYAADGTKLRTTHTIGGVTTTTDYCGNVNYEDGVQKQLLTEEGYVDLAETKYYYYQKDHQGNNRVVVNSSGVVQEANHYYPFGGLFTTNSSVQKFKYNGKEFDSKGGLNWYDYGARHYDATLGRWHVVDPMAEEMYAWSPYGYCFNNPTKFVDEDGMLPGPGDLFKTPRSAAKDWGWYYNGLSIVQKKEFGSSIYIVKDEQGIPKGYSYSVANIGTEHTSGYSLPPNNEEIIATIHSHGDYTGEFVDKDGQRKRAKDNEFSLEDIKHNKSTGRIGYLATPNGSLLEHNPTTDEIQTITIKLPSDPKDPTRKNATTATNRPNKPGLLDRGIDWIKELFE